MKINNESSVDDVINQDPGPFFQLVALPYDQVPKPATLSMYA